MQCFFFFVKTEGGEYRCFFFSSRRRHTRWTGDWSSDVCSSDLIVPVGLVVRLPLDGSVRVPVPLRVDQVIELAPVQEDAAALPALVDGDAAALVAAHGAVALGTGEHALAHGSTSGWVAREAPRGAPAHARQEAVKPV